MTKSVSESKSSSMISSPVMRQETEMRQIINRQNDTAQNRNHDHHYKFNNYNKCHFLIENNSSSKITTSTASTSPTTTASARRQRQRPKICGGASLLLLALCVVLISGKSSGQSEAKEFDWSELGVSLATSPARSSLNGSSLASNNLRILVSPQRRLSKG